jgi:hypothetical protein
MIDRQAAENSIGACLSAQRQMSLKILVKAARRLHYRHYGYEGLPRRQIIRRTSMAATSTATKVP